MHRSTAAAAVLLLLFTGCTAAKPQTASRDLFAMDTFMDLTVTCKDPQAALEEAEGAVEDLEKAFSVNLPDSDISRINAQAGTPVQIGEDTAAVLAAAVQYGDESGGALDITVTPVLQAWGFTTGEYRVPARSEIEALLQHVDYSRITLEGNTAALPEGSRMDLGALAKGYTGDRLLEIFREHGAESALVNLGGNVQTLGRKPDGSLWKVGICDPMAPDTNLGAVEIENCAVITSGNYERYFEEDGVRYWHILDPADGAPADNGLVSVTVMGESGLMCDALSTAIFVEGLERGIEHWRSRDDFEMILVTDAHTIYVTQGAAAHFTVLCDSPVEVIGREAE